MGLSARGRFPLAEWGAHLGNKEAGEYRWASARGILRAGQGQPPRQRHCQVQRGWKEAMQADGVSGGP